MVTTLTIEEIHLDPQTGALSIDLATSFGFSVLSVLTELKPVTAYELAQQINAYVDANMGIICCYEINCSCNKPHFWGSAL